MAQASAQWYLPVHEAETIRTELRKVRGLSVSPTPHQGWDPGARMRQGQGLNHGSGHPQHSERKNRPPDHHREGFSIVQIDGLSDPMASMFAGS